jgi:general L-amino acid transport system substrate-binding protein
MRKALPALFAASAIILAACNAPATPAAPAAPASPIEVTREVEVTRIVEVTVASAAEPVPAATEAPSTPATTSTASMEGKTLETIKARGKLVCGVNGQLPGFSDATNAGFDADFCRAIAAAIFGNKDAVEFKALTAEARFDALKNGEVDVLIRNTTWTLSRDADGMRFGSPTFYDGQGLMVRNDSGVAGLEDLEGDTVCVQKGTTTEATLNELVATLKFTVATFDDFQKTFAAYADKQCTVVTADKTALITQRGVLADPQNHLILDATLSKEPLAPVVRDGDDKWLDVVNWVGFALIAAEEYNINSQNVDAQAEGDTRAEVRRILGSDPNIDLGASLGLPKAWALNAIKAVGNYAQIYDRHFGPTTVNQIPRGLNNLYRNAGLLYAPPFR